MNAIDTSAICSQRGNRPVVFPNPAPALAVLYSHRLLMATTYLYRCRNTGQTVQGWSADDVSDDDEYQSIACLACALAHLINLKTGKVLGAKED